VSTHDLTLADDPATARLVHHVHFRETITSADGRPEMTFDYRLRPGLATSTNALLLMDLIGLSRP
jgi:DNA mismatch repair ATPase MutS